MDKIGLLHPIVVNYNPKLYGKKYKLCSGYLRLQHAVKRGQEKIWANVKKGLTKLQELEIELAENEARFDFNDAERDIF
ncbi:MAG: hypothetical protein JW891_04260, partial [Candidatus Lokiarchaeota archaeon]|nr:hypothetical protein [Candidatus Lokiarchaeota archaeon]